MPQPAQPSRIDRALTVAGKARSADGRLAPATNKKYGRALTELEDMCRRLGLIPMPCTSETLAEYAQWLLQQGYKRSTAEGRIYAVRAKHRERGEPVPDGVAAWYVLRGADLTTAGTSKVNTPLARRGALEAIAGVCDVDTAAGARDLCMVTLAWDLLATEAELTRLDIADVREVHDGATHDMGRAGRPAGEGLVIRVGEHYVPVEHDHEPAQICPVEAAQRWIRMLAAAGSPGGALCRSVDAAGNIGGCGPKSGSTGDGGRLNVRGLQRIWKRLCVRAQLPISTPRALRLGGAADDLAEGTQLVRVMRRGRWSLDSATALRRLVVLESGDPGQQEGQ